MKGGYMAGKRRLYGYPGFMEGIWGINDFGYVTTLVGVNGMGEGWAVDSTGSCHVVTIEYRGWERRQRNMRRNKYGTLNMRGGDEG